MASPNAAYPLIPINHTGQSSLIAGNVSRAIPEYAIPPIDAFRWAKYFAGSDSTISIPRARRCSCLAIRKPQKLSLWIMLKL